MERLGGESGPRMTQVRANRLCRAASAVYYSICEMHANRMGVPALLPEHLCPKDDEPRPCPYEFALDELEDAERMLLRLGVIGEWDRAS